MESWSDTIQVFSKGPTGEIVLQTHTIYEKKRARNFCHPIVCLNIHFICLGRSNLLLAMIKAMLHSIKLSEMYVY